MGGGFSAREFSGGENTKWAYSPLLRSQHIFPVDFFKSTLETNEFTFSSNLAVVLKSWPMAKAIELTEIQFVFNPYQ